MHEFGVTESLLKIVEESANNAGVEKVSRIVVVVGQLTGFVPDCITFYFETMSQNTIAEGATLDFEEMPVRLKCRQCGHEFVPETREWACPECQSSEADITGGRELYVKELEVT
jgi:hydrogenase nickel incorporation protein HypA/HybF